MKASPAFYWLLVVMTTASDGVVLPVGGVILELILSARVSPGENPVHLLDERRRRLWRRWRRHFSARRWKAFRWFGGWLGAGGELQGRCLAFVVATKIILAAGGCHMGVGSGCLQRTAAVDIAWQLSVRRGTASEGGACGNDKVGRLDLQRIVAGSPATLWLLRCGPSSEDDASDNLD